MMLLMDEIFQAYSNKTAGRCSEAPLYQSEHKQSLAQDWAHIPVPKSSALFKERSLGHRTGEARCGRLSALVDGLPERCMPELRRAAKK